MCLKSKLHKHGTTFFCECGLIPPCTHTHTHTHTRTHTHTHTRARAHTHTLTGMRLNVHGDQLTFQKLKEKLVACFLSFSLSLSLSYSLSLSLSLSHTHTHTHRNAPERARGPTDIATAQGKSCGVFRRPCVHRLHLSPRMCRPGDALGKRERSLGGRGRVCL